MADRPDGLLEVGTIGRPHGVRGEVYVTLLTDRADRVALGARVWARDRWLTVTRSKPQQQRFLVVFGDIETREQAAAYTGTPSFLRSASLSPPSSRPTDERVSVPA